MHVSCCLLTHLLSAPCSIEESEDQLMGAGLTQEIVVPFPVESVLSGQPYANALSID